MACSYCLKLLSESPKSFKNLKIFILNASESFGSNFIALSYILIASS